MKENRENISVMLVFHIFKFGKYTYNIPADEGKYEAIYQK